MGPVNCCPEAETNNGLSGRRPLPALAKKSRPEDGASLEFASVRKKARIKHLVAPILSDIGHV